jgi:hypothetical protein
LEGFVNELYRVFREQPDWTLILPSELPTKELGHLLKKMPSQAYQTSQYVVPRGGIFLGKWRSTFAESSDGKTNVQSACALNTLYETWKFVKVSPRHLRNGWLTVVASGGPIIIHCLRVSWNVV